MTIAATVLVLYGCSAPESSPPDSSTTTAGAAAPSFVNKVWVVVESKDVAPGELRVFLSDGTLVMTSPHATPAFGKWRYTDEELTITEESLDYRVEILELTESSFRIRILSPGEPIEILFAPADRKPTVGNEPEAWIELESGSGSTEPVVRVSGTVHHLDVEGGVFVIRDESGTQYNPVNLPAELQIEGLAVEADTRRADGVASIGMVGPMVELLRIRIRAGAN